MSRSDRVRAHRALNVLAAVVVAATLAAPRAARAQPVAPASAAPEVDDLVVEQLSAR